MKKNPTFHTLNYFVFILIASFFLTLSNLTAQSTRKVLFLGNSYTAANNLPQIIHDAALSAGDTLVFDGYTPGGYQLIDHSADVTSQNKIMAGGWDYVVLQGQSQEPILASNQFISGGSALYNLVKQYNPCAVIMPYMTWGRKNGDAANCPNFPIMCTYQGMDTTLRDRYLYLTALINGEVAPVSVVRNYLRQNYPGIELYDPDESHPSPAGSYAAACCFYASLFKKDPSLITFNFGLNAGDAALIRNAAKIKVFDTLQLWDLKRLPIAKIQYEIGPGSNEVIFHAAGLGFQETYFWDFGDGTNSSLPYSPHSYLADGTYTVSLTTTNCDLQGLHTSTTDTTIQFCGHTPTVYTTHPWICEADTLWTQPADSYQWYAYGLPIPETNQYLADHAQYGVSGFSVISTLSACAELSVQYTQTPVWSGYYFDIVGSPCVLDTVAFAVLHINGFLSGLELIQWYKNDTLLPFMANEDTLLLTTGGKYECKVTDPNSNCPSDITSYSIVYDCGGVGMEEKLRDLFWSVFPNPASETITIKFSQHFLKEQIRIYNATGRLMKVKETTGTTSLSISDLPKGLYFILLKNKEQHPVKFIKQ